MRCLCCSTGLTSAQAKFWNNKIVVCASCFELATRAERELTAAMRRAEALARAELEQRVLNGTLLQCPGFELIGFGHVA